MLHQTRRNESISVSSVLRLEHNRIDRALTDAVLVVCVLDLGQTQPLTLVQLLFLKNHTTRKL